MANIVVFEDQGQWVDTIHDALKGSEHTVTAEAYTIREAHQLLSQLALGELHADYALLDGSLGHDPEQPTFRFTPPGLELPAAPSKKWYQKARKPATNLHEIVVEADPGQLILGRDGRQISRIIRACKLPTTIIGISSDPARRWHLDVDYDLTKQHIKDGLLDLILELEDNKETR